MLNWGVVSAWRCKPCIRFRLGLVFSCRQACYIVTCWKILIFYLLNDQSGLLGPLSSTVLSRRFWCNCQAVATIVVRRSGIEQTYVSRKGVIGWWEVILFRGKAMLLYILMCSTSGWEGGRTVEKWSLVRQLEYAIHTVVDKGCFATTVFSMSFLEPENPSCRIASGKGADHV